MPSKADIATLNQDVSAMVATKDGPGLLQTFEHKTVPFLFLTAANIVGAIPLLEDEIGARMGGLAPGWLPSDLLQLDPAGLRWFLDREGYSAADVERAVVARAAVADVVAGCTFVEGQQEWLQLKAEGAGQDLS
jgi:hypothetical protein